jgi:hypothetical protein
MSVSLILQVHDEAADAEELGELGADLRQTLRGAGIDGCSIGAVPVSGRGWNSMERTTDPAVVNTVLLILASSNVLQAVSKVISTWASTRHCTVKVESGDGNIKLEFTGNANDLPKAGEVLSAVTANDSSAAPVRPAEPR